MPKTRVTADAQRRQTRCRRKHEIGFTKTCKSIWQFTNLLPGRWSDARAPSPGELEASIVLKLMISEASAKIRTGPPLDDEPDYKLPHWAGVIPIAYRAGEPIPEERIHPDAKIPDYIRRFVARMNMQK